MPAEPASPPKLGIIGGTGLYSLAGLEGAETVEVDTPFGKSSAPIVIGEIAGTRTAFVPRHGVGHRLLPTEVPYLANVYALKALGVERLVSVSAVGSLRDEIAPLHVVIPDQLIDRTRQRTSTFFGGGMAAHVGFADPFCPHLSASLYEAARQAGGAVHRGGAYVVIEGPAFSTRAESHVYRSWGASIIGMTALPEAKLAREAEMCYATLACVTDYDVWRESEADVSVEMVIANLQANAQAAQRTLEALAAGLGGERPCGCGNALANAIVTSPAHIGPEARERLAPIIGKYLA